MSRNQAVIRSLLTDTLSYAALTIDQSGSETLGSATAFKAHQEIRTRRVIGPQGETILTDTVFVTLTPISEGMYVWLRGVATSTGIAGARKVEAVAEAHHPVIGATVYEVRV